MCIRKLLPLLTALFGLSVMTLASADSLRMTANIWPPYVDDRMSGNGVAIALATEALVRAGYPTDLVLEPWPRAMEATESGEYDVICSLWLTDERSATLAFSQPFIENHIKFVKRSNSDIQYYDRDDLEGLRIGVVDDYAYSAEPYDTSGIDITESGSVRGNLKRLLNGEIDLVLADSRVAFYEIDRLVAAKNLTVIQKPVITRGLRIAVSRQRSDYAEIIAAFDRTVAQMKEDGSYNTLMANYRISD
jgi:polar amino acid transport system substrate-binding protein